MAVISQDPSLPCHLLRARGGRGLQFLADKGVHLLPALMLAWHMRKPAALVDGWQLA